MLHHTERQSFSGPPIARFLVLLRGQTLIFYKVKFAPKFHVYFSSFFLYLCGNTPHKTARGARAIDKMPMDDESRKLQFIACAMTLSAFSTILILFICEWLFTSVWAQTIMAIVCSFSVGLWIWRSTIHHFKEKENAQTKSS